MIELSFEEVVAATRKLPSAQKAALIQTLQMPPIDNPLSPEELIAELEALRAVGAFDHVESLRNKYATSALDDVSDEELRATIHDAANEWEKEIDEIFADED